jgi:hypothetical protein
MAAESSTSRIFPGHQKICRTSGVCSSRQSLAVCLFPTIGLSGAGINALQDPRPSSFVHALPYPCSRKAAGSRVVRASHTGGCSAQVSCHSPGDGRKRAGFGSHKRLRSGHAKRSRSAIAAGLLLKHICFRPFSIGNLDWNSGIHVPNRAILERETGSNAKSNPYLGRWNVGGTVSRSNPKNWIGHLIWNAWWRFT